MLKRWGVLLVLLCLAAGGCKPVSRFAWASEYRVFPGFRWPAAMSGADKARVHQAQGLSNYLSGLLAEGSGDLSGAESRYREALEKDPDGIQILLRLGAVYMKNNDLPKAIATFEKASEQNPADPRPRFLLGILYASQQRFEDAARQYSAVLADDPGNLGALSYLADLYLLQEKLQEGLQIYERLIRERPESPVVHFNVGILYAKVNRWQEAITHLSKSIELDPGNLEARLALGVSFELSGQLSAARQVFLDALELEPSNTRLIHYLAQICYRGGDLEEAGDWMSRYLSFKPREAAAYLELAYLRIEQGRWEEAVRLLQASLELDSGEEPKAEYRIALGMAYQSGRLFPEAELSYKEAVALAPADVKGYLYLATLYHRYGRYPQAEETYRTAFRLNPDDPELLNGLGYLYADWGANLEEAVTLIRRALAQDPDNGAYMDSLGWAYFKQGRIEEALSVLKKAASRMPDPEVLEHLGQAQLAAGDPRAARESWEQALALQPKDPQLARRLQQHLKSLPRVR